jgi:hypothetical protein
MKNLPRHCLLKFIIGEPTFNGRHRCLPLRAKKQKRRNWRGKEKVGDREVYVIEATPEEGGAEKMSFDTQTGLLIYTDVERERPQGKIRVETHFEDYREVDGTKLPFTMRQSSPNLSFIIRINEVKHNIPIEDAKFNKPATQ